MIKVPAVSMSAELLAAVEDKKIAVDMSVWIIEAVTVKKLYASRHLSRTGLCIELVFNRVGTDNLILAVQHSLSCTYTCSHQLLHIKFRDHIKMPRCRFLVITSTRSSELVRFLIQRN